jgi:hypothetical protein
MNEKIGSQTVKPQGVPATAHAGELSWISKRTRIAKNWKVLSVTAVLTVAIGAIGYLLNGLTGAVVSVLLSLAVLFWWSPSVERLTDIERG